MPEDDDEKTEDDRRGRSRSKGKVDITMSTNGYADPYSVYSSSFLNHHFHIIGRSTAKLFLEVEEGG